MRRAKVRPDLVLCSSAARARQTYEAVSAGVDGLVTVSVEDDLFGASDTGLLVRLQDVPEAVEAVLLVGHNPGLQDLALMLTGDGDPAMLASLGDKFPTCALADPRGPDVVGRTRARARVPQVSGSSPTTSQAREGRPRSGHLSALRPEPHPERMMTRST